MCKYRRSWAFEKTNQYIHKFPNFQVAQISRIIRPTFIHSVGYFSGDTKASVLVNSKEPLKRFLGFS
jgi:hypothetical protein